MITVDGIEYCVEHGGICAEGTDYTGERLSLGCEYPERETPNVCRLTSLYIDSDVT